MATTKAVTMATQALASTLAPALLTTLHAGNLTANLTGNDTHGGHHSSGEGGFLSGRNPFAFNPPTALSTISVQLVVIICMSRLVKFILSPIKQPSVIAEIISGIVLGPTAFGHIPGFSEFVFPKPSLPYLGLLSNFGMVLYLFLVGLELDPNMLKKSVKTSLLISMAGMALPFVLGCGTSYILFEYVEPPEHQNNFFSYVLFLGVAMAITAFPVLARILTELNLLKTKCGGITIAAAAVDDVTSWCLLALVVSILNATDNMQAIYVFLMGLAYVIFLILVIRPILVRILRGVGTFDHETPPQSATFLVLMIVIISSFITDAIGIHAIFGGFVAGIIIPHQKGFAFHVSEKLEDIVQIIFLPLYFALSGLKTRIGALDNVLDWGVVGLVILVACIGKIVGCTLAARVTRLSWRESFAVGTLMNCKGLVELIVLNLGYDAGVISSKTFAIMVIMALVTTFITVPLVNWTFPPEFHDEVKPQKKKSKEPTLMVSVNRVEQVGPILSIMNLLQQKMTSDGKYHHNRNNPSATHSRQNSGGMLDVPMPEETQLKSSSSFSSLANIINLVPSGGKGKAKANQHGGINISVLRLIQLTDRDSSVMLSANDSALSNDPVTRLVKTFCEVTNKRNTVEGIVKVVTLQMYGKVMAQVGADIGAHYILVPWSGSGSMEEDYSRGSRYSPTGPRRRLSIHTPPQHSNFLQDLMNEAKSSVLVFVDRGGPVLTADMIKTEGDKDALGEVPEVSRKQIWLPFFGGADDREALSLVLGLRHLNTVRVNIIRYKTTVEKGEGHQNGSIASDDQDEKMLHAYFGQRKGSNESGQSISTAIQQGGIIYNEVETNSPMTKCVETFARLGGTDLIICGKRNLKVGGGSSGTGGYTTEDGERRKVLGDVAEGLLSCQCVASVLVVHAVHNTDGAIGNV